MNLQICKGITNYESMNVTNHSKSLNLKMDQTMNLINLEWIATPIQVIKL
jgi:hypothetical protein